LFTVFGFDWDTITEVVEEPEEKAESGDGGIKLEIEEEGWEKEEEVLEENEAESKFIEDDTAIDDDEDDDDDDDDDGDGDSDGKDDDDDGSG